MKDAWEVLTLFIIPIGGGIPAGVLLAKARGIHWPITLALYFISDVLLALCFEPILLLLIALGKKSAFLARFTLAFKEALKKTTGQYGNQLSPLSLIGVSFGVDPMTGRAVAVASGHGFVAGWALAIAGDMIFFGVMMVSTLWLNGILGNGTWATLIILTVMILLPTLIRRIRTKWKNP